MKADNTCAPENRNSKTPSRLDRIRGSLIGGAAGDALGYSVEFSYEQHIFDSFGPQGITEYNNNPGRISDDTQMTLFTANGILNSCAAENENTAGLPDSLHRCVAESYHDWYLTQTNSLSTVKSFERGTKNGGFSWLLDVPELFARRAPGNTCMSALSANTDDRLDFINSPLNNSKGCGGIMRIAPLALRFTAGVNYNGDISDVDIEGAQLAAVTHSHSLGFMPAAVMTHIIGLCLAKSESMTLTEMVIDARCTVSRIFEGDEHLPKLNSIIDLAIELSGNGDPDLDNIHKLGAGWVAEETLGIALYCALKYQNDFSKALIASVNHNGDSDSTGAVTGNIVGALIGYEAIEEKWKNNLELHDVILEIADDLYRAGTDGCHADEAFNTKYKLKRRYEP